MRFDAFLRATVMLSAATASMLVVVTLAAAATTGDADTLTEVAVVWWVLAGLLGLWLGRRASASPPIAALLAAARTRSSLPEVNPARVILGRLWPLLVLALGSVLVGVALPQVPAIAAGFAGIWALAWRRQGAAVQAIEGRDGARFYIEPSSPLRSMALVRTPGFRSFSELEPPPETA